jgi:hypothetical protein
LALAFFSKSTPSYFMPLTVQSLQTKFQARLAPGNDPEFYRLLTEADERLLSSGRWHWTRKKIELTPDEDFVVALPDEFESIVGCRIDDVAAGVRWEEADFISGDRASIPVDGCMGVITDLGLLTYGSDENITRLYQVHDSDAQLLYCLVRYEAKDAFEDPADTVLCPIATPLKQMMMAIIYEEANDTNKSLEYKSLATGTLNEHEAAYRGTAKEVFRPTSFQPVRRRSRINFP